MFGEILILSCGIAVLQYQGVCSIYKISGNFNAVGGFLVLFCAVLRRISARFGLPVFVPPLRPPCVAVSYFS